MTEPLTAEQIERRKELAVVLRAGEYKRGTGCLQEEYRTGHYCCLGVACCVAERHGVHVAMRGGRLVGGHLQSHQPDVERYYGFTAGEQGDLSDMNDTTNDGEFVHSWDAIAAYIETGVLR